ncbi:hypothetical protein QR685DRAFT_536840, partial [Neurospora intermedia]
METHRISSWFLREGMLYEKILFYRSSANCLERTSTAPSPAKLSRKLSWHFRLLRAFLPLMSRGPFRMSSSMRRESTLNPTPNSPSLSSLPRTRESRSISPALEMKRVPLRNSTDMLPLLRLPTQQVIDKGQMGTFVTGLIPSRVIGVQCHHPKREWCKKTSVSGERVNARRQIGKKKKKKKKK